MSCKKSSQTAADSSEKMRVRAGDLLLVTGEGDVIEGAGIELTSGEDRDMITGELLLVLETREFARKTTAATFVGIAEGSLVEDEVYCPIPVVASDGPGSIYSSWLSWWPGGDELSAERAEAPLDPPVVEIVS